MRGGLLWIAAGLIGACYSPRATGDCDVICSASGADPCPDDFTCGASGRCSASGHACPGDVSDTGACFGSGLAKPCVPAVPPDELKLSGTIDTDRDRRCVFVDQPMAGPQLCVIAGQQIAIVGPVHATGTRPLVLVATETITVSFPLDARSVHNDAATGAGAGSCPGPGGFGEGGIGTGGAGGSFQGSGGAGGGTSGMAGALPDPPVAFPDHVRGGCAGGEGGDGTSNVRGKGGAGGGALYLIANEAIDVQSTIAVNGAGAFLEAPEIGARAGGGGGGGGSGGLLALEAPAIRLGGAARLLAMGGGGAGGGGTAPGQAGGDASLTAGLPAIGGVGGAPSGGAGGDGSFALLAGAPAGDASTVDPGGGGGGGGGAGFIKLICTACPAPGAVLIPPPTP